MKLLDVLASGVAGAENGSVDIYQRGTSTRAQIFTDYDGTGAQTPSASIPLDSNGGGTIYVNQPVLCQVRDFSGNLVRQFTAFETATDVEVISRSFTGVNYQTGVSAFSNPTLLSQVLDLWFISSGAIDFNVLVGSASTTIQVALAGLANVFFNVKSYGAIGDGAADDTGAINTTKAASDSAGGIMFFPPGTYKITSGLTFSGGTTGIWGTLGSVITTTVAMTMLTVTNGSQVQFSARNILLNYATGPVGTVIASSGTIEGLFDNVSITSIASGNTRVVDWASSGKLITIGGKWSAGIGNQPTQPFRSTSGAWIALGTHFLQTSATVSSSQALVGVAAAIGSAFVGCQFDTAASLSSYLLLGVGVAVGCNFATPSAGTVASALSMLQTGSFEFGNSYNNVGAGVRVLTSGTPADATTLFGKNIGRSNAKFYSATDAAAVTIDVASYGTITIARTTGGAQTLTLSGTVAPGEQLVLNVYNGAGTPTITFTTIKGLANKALAVNTNYTWLLQSVDKAGVIAWVVMTPLAAGTIGDGWT